MSYYQKPAILPYVLFFNNNGHVGWCTASPDTILKLETLVMIQTKFGFHWSSTFRGEDFWKSLRRTTDDNDGRQVMAIAHMTLWVRWAKKCVDELVKLVFNGHLWNKGKLLNYLGLVWFMVFNSTFNNISVILWWSVLLVEETGGPRKKHWPVASHWQTLSHNVVNLALIEIRTHNISGDPLI